MNSIATKLDKITKIATDEIVTIVLGVFIFLEQRYTDFRHWQNNFELKSILSNNPVLLKTYIFR